jgi:diguanylate cyclase (GGDEF)-like protein
MINNEGSLPPLVDLAQKLPVAVPSTGDAQTREALEGEVVRLRRELEDTRSRLVEVERQADEDPMLPVLCRRAFLRELRQALAVAQRHNHQSFLVYVDIDGLQRINETLGHSAGDAALGHLANILLAQVRATDVVGRLGGDEFGLLLAHCESLDGAQKKAAEIAMRVNRAPLVWRDAMLALSISIGVRPVDGTQTVDQVMEAADIAMYEMRRDRYSRTTAPVRV